MEKRRASRNRTIEIKEEEKSFLAKNIIGLDRKVTDINEIVNRTLCSDLYKVIDFLPCNFADLIILDPPYNLSKDFNGRRFSERTEGDYIDFLESWFPKIVQRLKPDGSLYLCGDWKCSTAQYSVAEKYLNVINRITWQREKGRGAKKNWKNGMEDIWFCVKDKNNYYFNIEAVKICRKVMAPYRDKGKPKDWEENADGKFRMTCPSNFWDDITIPYWSMPENTEHPTQKPEKLVAKLILASCPEGGIVFDPFLGSGTSSVVAKKLNRRYFGIEIDPDYCLYTEKRLELAESKKRIQGYEHHIFWERNSSPQKNKPVK